MNIYSDPEKFGLELVADHDFAGDYEFNQVLLFKDSSGRFLVAHDAGCSCPTPFENVGIDDLVEVHSIVDVAQFVRKEVEFYYISEVAFSAFMERVMAVMS